MISPELARIIAHIAADGYTGTYKQRRSEKEQLTHPRKNMIRKRWRVRYVNTEPDLVRQFVRDVKKEFNLAVIPYPKHEYEISAKWVYEIITRLGALKSHTWFIPQQILKAPKPIKAEWLKAFYDDESYVSCSQKRITLNMVNVQGLQQIKLLLQEFGIFSTLRGPYRYKQFCSYHLCIYHDSIKKFYDEIGFYHPKKKRHLAQIIKIINGGAEI